MAQLSTDQIDSLKAAFSLFDKDGDGSISAAELKESFAQLGQTPSDEEIQLMISETDHDGDGKIDFNEFKRMMTSKILGEFNEQQ